MADGIELSERRDLDQPVSVGIVGRLLRHVRHFPVEQRCRFVPCEIPEGGRFAKGRPKLEDGQEHCLARHHRLQQGHRHDRATHHHFTTARTATLRRTLRHQERPLGLERWLAHRLVPRQRQDRSVHHRLQQHRLDAVHAVLRVIRERAVRQHCVLVGAVPDRAAVKRQRVRGNAHPIRVDLASGRPVAEPQHLRRPSPIRRPACVAPYRQLELRRPRHRNAPVETHRGFDLLTCRIALLRVRGQ